MFNYEIKVHKVSTVTSGGTTNVVSKVSWSLNISNTTDEELAKALFRETTIDAEVGANFIEFAELTEQDVASWIEASCDMPKLRMEARAVYYNSYGNLMDNVELPWDLVPAE